MSLFQYSKSLYRRVLSPRQRKTYRGYKPYLQREFKRLCVYCQQPDSTAPNLNFGVDHYRPKSIPRFSNLICDYNNLFYCCGKCNSRKSSYWPIDEKNGPFIVNPCDFKMTDHVWFDSSTCEIISRSKHGKQTIDLLQLNCSELIAFRKQNLRLIEMTKKGLVELEQSANQLALKIKQGKITQNEFDAEYKEIKAEQSEYTEILENLTGTKKLNPIRSRLPH
jgi:hypothetical protein